MVAYLDFLSPQPDAVMAGYCPDVERDAPKVASAHQARDLMNVSMLLVLYTLY